MDSEVEMKAPDQKEPIDLPVATAPFLGMRTNEIRRMLRQEMKSGPSGPIGGSEGRKVPLDTARSEGGPPKLIGLRHYLGEEEGEGYWDFIIIRNGLYLGITDAVYRQPVRMPLPAEPLFKIRLMLSGTLYDMRGRPFLKSGDACVHTISGNAPVTYRIEPSDEPCRMIVVHGQAKALVPLGLDVATLGEPFDAVARDELPDAITPIPGGLSLSQVAQDIFSSRDRFTADLRGHYLSAKTEELLCSAIERTRPRKTLNTGANRMLSRDIMRLHEARSILSVNTCAPPTIPELSRMIGMNTTKLKTGFRELFGETIQAFLTRVRLESALTMVETSDLSLSEISYKVGYRYPANFTQAFKKRFGVTPGQARISATRGIKLQ